MILFPNIAREHWSGHALHARLVEKMRRNNYRKEYVLAALAPQVRKMKGHQAGRMSHDRIRGIYSYLPQQLFGDCLSLLFLSSVLLHSNTNVS